MPLRNRGGTKTNLTLKNLPKPLYAALKESAAASRRSLNSEVIHRLEQSVGLFPLDTDELLERVRVVRERARLPYLTAEDLRSARERGRS